jgi:NADPH:quinone reductase
MRAVTVNEYGSQPRVSDVPKPKAGPGQVLIKVLAAGMNPMDRSIAMGAWKDLMPAKFPLVLGADVAGVVEEIGTDESRFHRGDKVFGQLLVPPLGSTGTYADYVAVAAEAPLAEIPAALDPTVAAALPTPGATAYQIAKLLGDVQDKTVLVVGAAGSVGTFLTQLLAQSGARVIAAVRAGDADRVREYGALDTVDYTSHRVADTVRRIRPNGIDALVDVANNAAEFAALAATVRRGGTAPHDEIRRRRRWARQSGCHRNQFPVEALCRRAPQPRRRRGERSHCGTANQPRSPGRRTGCLGSGRLGSE